MNLIIIRHGIAEDKSNPEKDFDRKLSKQGIKEAKLMGKFLKKIKIKTNLILTSPFIRAKQTAEVIADKWNLPAKKILVEDELKPDGNKINLLNKAQDLIKKEKTITLVGHQPYLGKLMSLLIFNSEFGEIPLEKGAVAIFNVKDNLLNNKQEWLSIITPEVLKRIKNKK